MARGDSGKKKRTATEQAAMSTLGTVTTPLASSLPALLAAAAYNWSQGSGGALPPAPKAAAATTPAAVAAAAKQATIATPFLDAVRELFPGMKALSLNQLGSLSGSFNNMIPASAKAPTSAKDVMGMEYLKAAQADMAQKVAEARKLPSGGIDEERSAVQEYMQRISVFNGSGLAIPGLEEK